MQRVESVPRAAEPGQDLLLVDAAGGVLRLDEADGASRPADRVQVVEDLLDQQLADVLTGLELEAAVLSAEQFTKYKELKERERPGGGRRKR